VDEYRVNERITVHFDGHAEQMLDYLRTCIPVSDVEAIEKFLRWDVGDVLTFEGQSQRLIGVNNRFAVPSPEGYVDLKLLLQDCQTGFISTLRVIHVGVIDSQLAGWTKSSVMDAIEAINHLTTPTFFVVVADNFNHRDDRSLTVIHGFPNFDVAVQYAKSRSRELIRRLSRLCHSFADLKLTWIMLGEEMTAASSGDDHRIHFTIEELSSHLVEAPVEKPTYDWTNLEKDTGISKFALLSPLLSK
jgi:hypothetical protein